RRRSRRQKQSLFGVRREFQLCGHPREAGAVLSAPRSAGSRPRTRRAHRATQSRTQIGAGVEKFVVAGERNRGLSDVNLSIVREFFELNQFRVMTRWEHDQNRSSSDQGIQLYVTNTAPVELARSFVLNAANLRGLTRALVEIRAWHSDRFYPSVIDNSAALRRIVEEESLNRASDHFETHDFATILVISEL